MGYPAALLVGLAGALVSANASADITHIVQRGHTIEAIAHRYHVSEKAIIDANHLADPKHLRPGQSLVIPGVESPSAKKKHGGADGHDAREGHDGHDSHDSRDAREGHEGAAGRGAGAAGGGASGHAHGATAELAPPPEPRGHLESDTIHAVRLGEDFRIRVRDARGHVPSSALKAFERLMRQGNATHSVDPRLVTLVGMVSNHFGGATFEVVSGYRAYKPTQYTPHSNHNVGKAIDFHIHGVSNEAVRDFCRTLRAAGCGYYPNDAFVHLDVREAKAYWVDLSRPGEAPRYEKANANADEGTSDVAEDRGGTTAAPSALPATSAPTNLPVLAPLPVAPEPPAASSLPEPHGSVETQAPSTAPSPSN